MATNRTYTVIGGFLVGVVALVTIGVLVFGGTQLFKNERRAVIFFDQSVLGLSQGGRVLFRGVKIGTVQKVDLRVDPEADHARIAVTISMTDQDIKLNGTPKPAALTVPELVKRGLRGQLVIYSYVTAELAVNLSFKPDTPVDYAVDPDKIRLSQIPASQSQIAKVKDKVMDLPWEQTVKRVNKTMQSMIDLSQDLDKTVNALQPQIRQTNEITQQTLKTVQHAVETNNKQLQATIKQVQQLTQNANQATKAVNKQIDGRGEQLEGVLTNVQTTTKQLNQLTSNMNSLVAPGKQSRHDIKNILRDVSASAANLKDFSQTIERNPHALIYGGSK